MTAIFKYDLTHTFEQRSEEIKKILIKYPNRIPVLIEKNNSSDIPSTTKCKLLVPYDLTVGQLIYVIRKQLNSLPAEKALFIFVNNTLPMTGASILSLYEKHKSPDGFLRIVYSGENTFG
jgi:GABA(A) receptor-associated protein